MHRKRVAGIKHRGRGCNSDRGERQIERGGSAIYKTEKRSSRKNRHVISGCRKLGGNECEAYWNGLGKPQRAYMHTVHIRIERERNLRKRETKKALFQCLSLLRSARLESGTRESANVGARKQGNHGWMESTYSLNESYKNL